MASVHYSSTGRYVDLVQDNVILGKRVSYPAISINPYGKYIDINFEEFYYVVSHSANYFYSKLKSINFSSGKNIGLLSHSDSHYLWNMLGLMAVNVTPVLLSPRNSLEATVHLIKKSNSQVLVYQDHFSDMAIAIKKQIPSLILIPKWIAKFPDSLTPAKYTPLIPVESKQKELDNITYIIHSSGSTSFPKLISQTNRICFNSGHRFKLEETPLDRKEINFFPLFHTGGVLGTIIMYTYQLKSMTICPDLAPGSHFSSKIILDLVQNLSPELMGILPLMLKELIEYCNNVEYSQGWGILKKLEIMRYGGAQMPKQLVQFLIDNGITPVSAFASTECGMLMKSVSEWHDKGLPPSELTPGLQYTLKNWGDNVVELVISKDDPCLAYEFDRDEDGNYPTKDLFEIISNEPLLLQYFSRADDTIIHINGEKTNPIPMEDKLNSCPYIDRCAILGTGQQFNTLLVQLDTNELFLSPLHEVISTIKSYVKAVNESVASHSRIYEEMIYYLPIISEKKLPITIKGNLQRKKCAMMFKDEVKQSVEKMESGYVSRESPELEIISCDNEENIQHIVKECLRSCIDKQLGNNDSFFNNGMDSLSGMRFRNLLKSKIPDLEIKVTDIYDNDTAEKLIKFIKSSNLGKMLNTKSLEIYQKEVDDYITKYTFLGLEKPHSKKLPTENFHIAITGANGSLGSFMIKNLVEQDNVSKVYAFIRAKDHVQATEKLEHSFSKRFIDLCPEHSYKIVPIAINLHEDQLGLTQEAYAAITTKLTHIYHVGWTMNFLKGLDYFDDCIAASKNLMKLCVLSQRKVIYNFVSTIGATFPTASPVNTSVPELKLNTKLVNTAACNGYNLSKLVTETVCQIWSKDYDIPLHIYRVGQISGIQVMKLCPDILESSVAWIPVDVAADAIAEIGTQNQTVENTFMHIVNPKEYSWKVIYNALKSHGIEFGVVSVQEFIRQLKTNPEFQNADANPLATLTDFFDTIFLSGHVATLETKFTKKSSLAMAKCPALDSELMMKYLKFWNEQKFIQ